MGEVWCCCGGINQKIDARLVNKLSEGQQRHWEIVHYREAFGRVENKHQESSLTFACPYVYCRSVTTSVSCGDNYQIWVYKGSQKQRLVPWV